ncbi:MAG: hypothetical protein ABTD50_17380 [Polyangiaceae bacterium]|jgi:hypothetical protein
MTQIEPTLPRAQSPTKDGLADGPAPPDRSERLLEAMHREFPGFEIRRKKGDFVQAAISCALAVITLGRQRSYLTRYHTVLFGKLYVPESYVDLSDADRYILLMHERVHLVQRRRLGDLAMTFVYLVPLFPLWLAWGRARLEWEAYTATLRATAEVRGIDAARALESEIVRRFVGPDYGWMWPFPSAIRRWFRAVIAELEAPAIEVKKSGPALT